MASHHRSRAVIPIDILRQARLSRSTRLGTSNVSGGDATSGEKAALSLRQPRQPEPDDIPRHISIRFTPDEFRRLQQVYASYVIAGVWRDYGMVTTPQGCCFVMFHHTAEQPGCVVYKTRLRHNVIRWQVFEYHRLTGQVESLDDTILLVRKVAQNHSTAHRR